MLSKVAVNYVPRWRGGDPISSRDIEGERDWGVWGRKAGVDLRGRGREGKLGKGRELTPVWGSEGEGLLPTWSSTGERLGVTGAISTDSSKVVCYSDMGTYC